MKHLLAFLSVLLLVCGCVKTVRVANLSSPAKGNNVSASGQIKAEALSDYIKAINKLAIDGRPQRRLNARLLPKVSAELESQDKLLAQAKEALGDSSAEPSAHLKLAQAYHARSIYDQAYAHYSHALKLNPGDAAAHEGLGRLWRDLRMYELALAELNKAVSLKPDFAEAYNSLGTVYDHLGNYEEAEKAYLSALKIDPNADYIQTSLCFSFILRGKWDSAIEACTNALRLNPSSAIAHNNLGYALAMKGDYAGALSHFSSAQDGATAHNNLGAILLQNGMFDEAIAQFEAALSINPAHKEAIRNYNMARTQLRDETIRTDIDAQHPPRKVNVIVQNALPSAASQNERTQTRDVEIVPRQGPARVASYHVQVGSFKNPKLAGLLAADLASKGYSAFIEPAEVLGYRFYRVRIGKFSNRVQADALAQKLRNDGVAALAVPSAELTSHK